MDVDEKARVGCEFDSWVTYFPDCGILFGHSMSLFSFMLFVLRFASGKQEFLQEVSSK